MHRANMLYSHGKPHAAMHGRRAATALSRSLVVPILRDTFYVGVCFSLVCAAYSNQHKSKGKTLTKRTPSARFGGRRVGLGHRFAAACVGCVCGRRLGTGSGVSVRQTTNPVVRGFGRAFLCLSVCLSGFLVGAEEVPGAHGHRAPRSPGAVHNQPLIVILRLWGRARRHLNEELLTLPLPFGYRRGR
eukprot:scaffold23201_cov65-Phaeocystis_antarctica.AAC.9